MKAQPLRIIAILLTLFFTLPTPQLIAAMQEQSSGTNQDKPKVESPEEKELRKREENKKKAEEDRKNREAKERASEDKKYQTLAQFAEDLYAKDKDFRDQVDDGYRNLQNEHAEEAYRINILRRRQALLVEDEAQVLALRRVLYENPRLQEYVNRLGQQIVPEDSEKLYSFKVILTPVPSAYTLSTGTILISTGMISMLDNEAQLAYVLAHELAHVYKDHWRIKVMLPMAEAEYNQKQAIKRAFWAAVLTGVGSGVGAAIGGEKGAGIGAVSGLVAGVAVGNYYSKNIALDWNWAQENEADDFALRATMGKSFDVQEIPRLYATMAQAARLDTRIELGFIGQRSRIRERTEFAQKQISGVLQAQYQEALKANKIKGTSPEFSLVMAELKRDNGIEAFYYDMFQMAKANLQQSVMLRSDDALAAYYYGRVLKQVGRTKEELELAQQSLLKAVALDTRQDIPEVQLHRALLLMDNKEGSNNAEAISALKSYITLYERKRATALENDKFLPTNVDVLYGYMRLLGEKTWRAPELGEILKAPPTAASVVTPIIAPTQSVPRIEPASETNSSSSQRRSRKP
jgi:predicted Zn-dependent protease